MGFQKGLQGILYDHESDHLLACDAGGSRIIKLDPLTGTSSFFICNILFIHLKRKVYHSV